MAFIAYWQMPILLQPLNLYDEGVTLLGAKRFALGEVPYRDFFTIYPPLKFFFLGGIFKIFGASLFVARITFFLVSLSGFALLFFLFSRQKNIFFASIFCLLIALLGPLSLTPMLLFLFAAWFMIFLDRPENTILPFFGGGIIALLFLLRIDFGGFVGLSFFLLFALFVGGRKISFRRIFLILLSMATSFFVLVLPFVLWLWKEEALSEFWKQTLIFPLFGEYQQLRHLPWRSFSDFPMNNWTINIFELSDYFFSFFFFLPIVCGLLFWIFFVRASERQNLSARDSKNILDASSTPTHLVSKEKSLFFLLRRSFPFLGFLANMLFACFALAAFFYASHRSDTGHILFFNTLLLVFLFHLILLFRRHIWALFFLPFVFLTFLAPVRDFFQWRGDILRAEKVPVSFFLIDFPKSKENDDLEKVLTYFSENVPPDEPVYVGTSDTSRVFVNNVVLPFLLPNPVATKYHELHTGVVTQASVQRKMQDEMSGVSTVVLWDYFVCEPNESCVSTGVHTLDRFIQNNFTEKARFGSYIILRRDLSF